MAKYSFANVLYSYNSDIETPTNHDFQNVLHLGLHYSSRKEKYWSYEIGASLIRANYAGQSSITPTSTPGGTNNPITKKAMMGENQQNERLEFYSFPVKLNVHFLKYGFIGFGPKLNLTAKSNSFNYINQIGYVITLGAQLEHKDFLLIRLTTDFDNHTWYLLPQKKKHHLFFSNSLGVSVGIFL